MLAYGVVSAIGAAVDQVAAVASAKLATSPWRDREVRRRAGRVGAHDPGGVLRHAGRKVNGPPQCRAPPQWAGRNSEPLVERVIDLCSPENRADELPPAQRKILRHAGRYRRANAAAVV